MQTYSLRTDCQIKDVHKIAIGPQDVVPFKRALRMSVRKMLGPHNVKEIKRRANNMLNWYARIKGRATKPVRSVAYSTVLTLKVGDQVRVRSKDEIEATLDHWRQLKGCSFAPEMMQYCNTTQTVLKIVEQFVDERDLRIRRTKGIVLLVGIMCQGTSTIGRCDRSCYFFWREEWLEKI